MTEHKAPRVRVLQRDDGEFERVVMAEVLIPDIPNVFGDIYTQDAIREFAYEFARKGYGIDVNHDNVDVSSDVCVVESFIARESDPDFIPGSWVVAMKIFSDEIWQSVLAGEINGYSFEALCSLQPVTIENFRNRQVVGVTEPDPFDGHTHSFIVILSPLNKPIAGSTGVTDGHSHRIAKHTVTEVDSGHSHRYQVIVKDDV